MNQKSFLHNNEAVSFGYFVIAAMLIGGTAIWILLAPVFNQIFGFYNVDIARGMVTVQNQQAMQFHQNVIIIVPLIILLGVACWGIVRALEHKQEA